MTGALKSFGARDAAAFLAATALSILLAALIVVGDRALFAFAGLIVLVAIIVSARFRLLFLIFGGLVVFQSSGEVSVLKTGYVGAALVAIVMAALESNRRRDARVEPTLNFVFVTSFLLVGVLSAPTVAGVIAGTAPVDALRDGLPYLLLAASPILALDAAHAFDVRALRAIFGTVGMLAGVSFMVNWLNRRGLASLGMERLFLSSFMLCGATVSYAVSRIVDGARTGRTIWMVLACAIPGMVLITGTRAGLLLGVIPLAMFFVASRLSWTQRVGYAVVGLAIGLVTIVAIFLSVATLTGVDRGVLDERLTSLPGFSNSEIASQSLQERSAQRKAALAVWQENPVVGAGAGTEFSWFSPAGNIRTSFTIDSLLSFPAKFGIFGVIAMFAWLVAVARFTRARKRRGAAVAADALTVFAAFAASYGLLSSPLEEKGLAFGLILMFGLLMAESSSASVAERR